MDPKQQQNPSNPVPKGSPQSATWPTLSAPSPFQRNRSLAASPSFARRRASPPENQDDVAPKKRKVSVVQNNVNGDPPTANANGDSADVALADPARKYFPVDRQSLPSKIPNNHDHGRACDRRDYTSDGYLMDKVTYASNMISIRVQDMLLRLQSSLYGSGDTDSPTEEQNERTDIILDLLNNVNEAGSNIPMLKKVLLQKMRTLRHDRPFQNALFQVYSACMCHQNQTLRLGGLSSKRSNSTGLPSSKSL